MRIHTRKELKEIARYYGSTFNERCELSEFAERREVETTDSDASAVRDGIRDGLLEEIRQAFISAGHTCWLTSWTRCEGDKIFSCHDGVEEEITPQEFGEWVANTL